MTWNAGVRATRWPRRVPNATRGVLRVGSVGHREVASSRLRVFNFVDRLDGTWAVRAMAVYSDGLYRCAVRQSKLPHETFFGKVMLRMTSRVLECVAWLSSWRMFLWLAATTGPNDVILLQKVLPPAPLSRWLRRRSGRLVYDFDDAIQGTSRSARARACAVITASDAVMTTVASNLEFASRLNGHVEQHMTAVDTTRLRPRTLAARASSRRVGWIGTPSTTVYLLGIIDDLRRISLTHDVQFVFVGAACFSPPMTNVSFVPWSEDAECRVLPTLDVGLMPLTDSAWEQGKGGYKTLQYMACGVPTVASDVATSRAVVAPDATGLLVPVGCSWVEPICRLLDNDELRAGMGSAARDRALSQHSFEAALPAWERTVFGA